MKPLFLIAAAMTSGLAASASAQSNHRAMVAPVDRSTRPTAPGSSTITGSQTKGH